MVGAANIFTESVERGADIDMAKKAGTKRKENTSRAPTPTDRRVGENIRRLRTERDMTLAELGAALGISHQQLQKYETGTNRLSAGMLHNVSGILSVPIQQLFEDTNTVSKVKESVEDRMRRECHAWIDRARSLETLRSMAKVLKAMSMDR